MKRDGVTLKVMLLAGSILLASLNTTLAQNDRTLSIDTNRENAETRIERIHSDQRRPRSNQHRNIKLRPKGKGPQRYLQF